MQALAITPLETKLLAALPAIATLRAEAERLAAANIEPNLDRPAIIDQLIRLFNGPEQRDAKRLSEEALRESSPWAILRDEDVTHGRDIRRLGRTGATTGTAADRTGGPAELAGCAMISILLANAACATQPALARQAGLR